MRKDNAGTMKPGVYIFLTWVLILTGLCPVRAGMITQITPTVTITEEWTDNFLKSQDDTREEWITTYALGFTLGFLEKTRQIFLSYDPEYKDYKNFDERDSFDHNGTFQGRFQLSKHTNFDVDLGYDGHKGNNQGESWEHTASALFSSQLTKHLNFSIDQDYSKRFDEQERTGEYKEHEVNTTTVAVINEFGEKDRMGLDFSYEFDDYKEPDRDEYDEYNTSGFLTYWMTPLNGIDSEISYKNRELNDPNDDLEEYEGFIRYLRKFSRQLDGYIKYRHYLSQKSEGDHTIYHPSAGFDWEVTRDSGISLGLGVLFHDWEDGDTSTDPFIDLDVYKIYDFSRQGTLTLSGSSGYKENTGENINRGFSIYYKAGFDLDYQLQKHMSSNLYGSIRYDDYSRPTSQRQGDTLSYETGASLNYQMLERLSSNIFGSYVQTEYFEPSRNRMDTTVELGGGLSYLPLRWLRLSISYQFTDFESDASERGDYTKNEVTFSASFIPARPITPDRVKIQGIGEGQPTENK